jgi:hypothetical protein
MIYRYTRTHEMLLLLLNEISIHVYYSQQFWAEERERKEENYTMRIFILEAY